jgi:hypothetical protein
VIVHRQIGVAVPTDNHAPSRPPTSAGSARPARPPGDTSTGVILIGWVAALAGFGWLWWDQAGSAWWDSGGSEVVASAALVGAGAVLVVLACLVTRMLVGRRARRARAAINAGLVGAKLPARVHGLKMVGHTPAFVALVHDPDVHLTAQQRRRAVEVVTARAGHGAAYEATYKADDGDPELVCRRVKVDEPLPTMVPYPTDRPLHPDRIEYGVAAGGRIQAWDIKGSPHALVVGETGGGKTGTMRALIIAILRLRYEVWIIDPKKLEFRSLDGWPKVRRAGDARGFQSQVSIAAMIDKAHGLMEDRNDMGKEERERQPRIFLVVDEFFELVAGLNRYWKAQGNRGEHPAVGKLVEMATLARSARIHLLVGIQRPDTAVMSRDAGGVLRDQLGHRISVGRMKRGGAVMVWEDAYELAMAIPAVKPDGSPLKGRALATGPTGPREVQVWWVDFDDDEVMAALKPFAKLPPPPAVPLATAEVVEATAEVDAVEPEETVEDPPLVDALADSVQEGDVIVLRLDGALVRCDVVAVEADGDEVRVAWRGPDGGEGVEAFDGLDTVTLVA